LYSEGTDLSVLCNFHPSPTPSPARGEGKDGAHSGEREEGVHKGRGIPFTLTLRLRRTGLSATETLADLRHKGRGKKRGMGKEEKKE